MAYQYPLITSYAITLLAAASASAARTVLQIDAFFRNLEPVATAAWTGAVRATVSITALTIAVKGTTAARFCWASRPADSDGAIDWRGKIWGMPYLAAAGIGNRQGPGLVNATNDNVLGWFIDSTTLYTATEVATVPTFTVVGAWADGGWSRGFGVMNVRITSVAGVIGAGNRAVAFYVSSTNAAGGADDVLLDTDVYDSSAIALIAQGGATDAARVRIILDAERKDD